MLDALDLSDTDCSDPICCCAANSNGSDSIDARCSGFCKKGLDPDLRIPPKRGDDCVVSLSSVIDAELLRRRALPSLPSISLRIRRILPKLFIDP